MTSKDDRDIQEEMINLFQDFSFGVVKCVFTTLDLLLSRCNSFEDFKAGVKQTVVNLAKEEENGD